MGPAASQRKGQGQDLRDLQQQITESVAVHFDEGAAPHRLVTDSYRLD